MSPHNEVNDSVLELLELSSIESPFTDRLIDDYRRRLVDRLVENGKIDQKTADYLLD